MKQCLPVLVRVQVGERGSRRDPNIHYSTYYVCFTFFFFFFLQGAVCCCVCALHGQEPSYTSLSLSHILHPHHIQDKHPLKHVNLGTVGHSAMQPVHNVCLSDFPSDYITNQTLQHKAKKVSN